MVAESVLRADQNKVTDSPGVMVKGSLVKNSICAAFGLKMRVGVGKLRGTAVRVAPKSDVGVAPLMSATRVTGGVGEGSPPGVYVGEAVAVGVIVGGSVGTITMVAGSQADKTRLLTRMSTTKRNWIMRTRFVK